MRIPFIIVALVAAGALYGCGAKTERISGVPRFYFTSCPPDCSGVEVDVGGIGYVVRTHENVYAGTIDAYLTDPGSAERYLGSVEIYDLYDIGDASLQDGGQLRLQANVISGCTFIHWELNGGQGSSTSNPLVVTYPGYNTIVADVQCSG